MVASAYTIVSGTYGNEQELALELGFFIDFLIPGWSKVVIKNDTFDDYDAIYSSLGSVPGIYNKLNSRFRARSGMLSLYSMSSYNVPSQLEEDIFGGEAGSTHIPTGTSSGTYWFIGNEDAVHILVDSTTSGTVHAGFGFWDTYYNRTEDPKPFYIFGQPQPTSTFEGDSRVESFGPRSWGTSMSTTASGTIALYKALHPVEIAKGTINPRSGEPKLIEPVFYTDVTFPFYEVRGEIPGLYMCGGSPYQHGNVVTVTGTQGTDAGLYFIHKYTNDISWAIGPILSTVTGTNPVLYEGAVASGPVCHLSADSGVTLSGTFVSSWDDLSGNNNDWSQSDLASRPTFNTDAQNGLPTVQFNGTSDFIEAPSFLSGSTPGEIFIAAKNLSSAGTADGFCLFGSEGVLDSRYTDTDDEVYDSFGSTVRHSAGPLPYSPRNWHVYNASSSPSLWTSNQNNEFHYTTTGNTVGWVVGNFKIGESVTANWAGELGEVIVYGRILTFEERRKVINYLRNRWGVCY